MTAILERRESTSLGLNQKNQKMLLIPILFSGGFLAAVVNTVGITDDSRVFLRRSMKPSSGFPYRQKSIKPKLSVRQVNLDILGSPTASINGLFNPSGPQTPRPPPNDPQQNTRSNSMFRKKFFTYFQECHLGVRIHVEKITSICSGHITNENAKKIAWDLLVELQAILTLFLTCARKIKSCSQAPIPSSLPGASDKSPSVHDLAQIISQLLLQLKICFTQMSNVCSRFEIIRATCSDCLVQISSAASASLSVSGSHVAGLLKEVTNLFHGNLSSFLGLHLSGLDSIFNILKN